MLKKISMFITLMFVATLIGCTYSLETAKQDVVLIRTSVQVAVVEFLKYNPKYTDKVIEITSQIVEDADNNFQTLEATKNFVIDRIDFNKLEPAEKILVLNLIDSLEIETSRFIQMKIAENSDITPEETAKIIKVVVSWIRDSAMLMKM